MENKKSNFNVENNFYYNELSFKNLFWLTAAEAAIYIRRLDEDGNPSVKSIYNAIYRRKIRAKKFLGKWMIKKSDLDHSIETSFL